MARATTSLPVPLSPNSKTGARECPSFSMSRRIWQICGDCPTRPGEQPGSARSMNCLIQLYRIHPNDEGESYGGALAANPLGQSARAILRGLEAHQHAPQTRSVRSRDQPGPAVFRLHLAAQALGIVTVTESAHLHGELGWSGRRRPPG